MFGVGRRVRLGVAVGISADAEPLCCDAITRCRQTAGPGGWPSWRIQDKTGGGLIPQSQAGAEAGAGDGAAMVVVQVKDLPVVEKKVAWTGSACVLLFLRDEAGGKQRKKALRQFLFAIYLIGGLPKSYRTALRASKRAAAEVIYHKKPWKTSS